MFLKIWDFYIFCLTIETKIKGGGLSLLDILIHPLIKEFSDPLPLLSIPKPGPTISFTPDRHLHNGQGPLSPDVTDSGHSLIQTDN